jgi:uncharacterized OB-fold protein
MRVKDRGQTTATRFRFGLDIKIKCDHCGKVWKPTKAEPKRCQRCERKFIWEERDDN